MFLQKLVERIIDILDNRKSVTELAKPEDLVLSNASLADIKRGFNRVYNQLNHDDVSTYSHKRTTGEMIDALEVGQIAQSNENTYIKRESFAFVWCKEDGSYTDYHYFYPNDNTVKLSWVLRQIKG